MGQSAGGGKGQPSPPDFMAAAQQQTQANRPTQTTPFASSHWTQGPAPADTGMDEFNAQMDRQGVPQDMRANMTAQYRAAHPAPQGPWSQEVSLSPELQGANKSMQGQLSSAWTNPLDNGAQARQHAEDAIYGRATSRLDPQWAQREHDFSTGLANQGIDPSSEAYSKALSNFGRGRNDAYSTARQDAIMGGGQEAQRQQGMDIQSRMAPLAGMQGLQGLTGMPSFDQSQLLPAAIAQYQGALQQYGIGQQGKNSSMGGLMNLGGTLGAAKFLGPAAPVAEVAAV